MRKEKAINVPFHENLKVLTYDHTQPAIVDTGILRCLMNSRIHYSREWHSIDTLNKVI